MFFPKLCTKTLPAYPELALFRMNNSQSFSTHTLGCCFCSSALTTFLFTFLWKTHTNTLSHARVFVKVVKNTAPLSVCLCVCVHCVREEENFTFHWRSRPCWCGAAHRSWGAVCTTSAPLEVDDDDGRWWWQSYDIDWVGWNRENSIFPAAGDCEPGCGVLFPL